MTARRRRKSGSGPSATALIAWVGGAPRAAGAPAGTTVSGAHAWSSRRMSGGRAILAGRAFGLAAGTVLACGSVLASAVHVGDGAPTGEGAFLPSLTPAAPSSGAGTPDGSGRTAPAERTSAAPAPVSAQAFARTSLALRPQPARIHRNNPVSLDVPAEDGAAPRTAQSPWRSPAPPADDASPDPMAPVNPVLDPAASGVGRVAPVGEVLEPAAPHDEQSASPGSQAVVPLLKEATRPAVKEATQPAMTMLDTLLPRV
jgi:hypothetical protein